MESLLEGNSLFRWTYCLLAANEGNSGPGPCGETLRNGLLPSGFEWVAFFVAGLGIVMLLINSFLLLVMLYTYMERRLIGRFHNRTGPNRTGPFGLLQPVADAIKLLTKEDLVPAGADRLVFNIAPVLMIVPVLLVLAVLPFGENSFLANINVGILFVVAVTSMNALAMFMGGWASGNRFAMFGGMRAVAQLVSYEIPVVLSIVGILIYTGSLSMVSIVEAQRIPFILLQPLAFFIFIGSIYFRIITKITNLNSQNKSKLIAFGSILILLMNPNVTTYDFLIFVPSAFYLINEIKFKNKYLNDYQFKYSLIIIFILVQDINFPFFISSFIYFIVILSTFRNYDILELTKK